MTYYRIFQVLAIVGAMLVGVQIERADWLLAILHAVMLVLCLTIMEVERLSSTSPTPPPAPTAGGTTDSQSTGPDTAGRA